GLAHLGARLAGLLPLGLARLLGFLLRLARIFLAAPIAAVHSRASRHRIPLGGSSRRSVGATALSPFMITGGAAPPANISGFGACLHDRPDDPGSEFLFAHAGELAPWASPRRPRHDLLEDLSPHLGQRRALEDDSAIDVHVLLHVAVHERVGGELDGGHGLAAEDGAAARGEADHVAAARHQTGDGHGVVPWGVHEDEAARADGLPVEEHIPHGSGASLGDATQRLLEDGGDAARLVAGCGIVVHALAPAAVPLPPTVAIDELLGHRLADRAPDEQVLGAVDLRCLREHARAAVAHELVHRPAQRGIGGDTRVAVGAAAV